MFIFKTQNTTTTTEGEWSILELEKTLEQYSTIKPQQEVMTTWTNSPNITAEQVIYFMQNLKKLDNDLLKECNEMVSKKFNKKLAWGRRIIRNFEISLPRTLYKNLLFGSGFMNLKKRFSIIFLFFNLSKKIK